MSQRAGTATEAVVEISGGRVWLPEGKSILDGIDWKVRAGEQWALLGPNGSGKTTLLTIIRAFKHPSEGSVTVLGRRFGESDLWPLREQVGLVDASQRVLEWLAAEDVARVAPELTLTGADGAPTGVRYERLNILLINAVRQLERENAALRQRNATTERRLKVIERHLRTGNRHEGHFRSARSGH